MFCCLGKNYQFVDSKIHGFDNSITQTNAKFPFCWVVYQTKENHENRYPTKNYTLTVSKTDME